MKHEETHPEYVEGCKPCKWATVNVGSVPGTESPRSKAVTHHRNVERNLTRYRGKRASGEQPDGTTASAMEKYEKKVDLWERRESDIRDNNPPERVKEIRKALVNQ